DIHYHTYTFNQMKMEFDDWLHQLIRDAGNSVAGLARRPRTVHAVDPLAGNTVEAMYFKGSAEPLVEHFATHGTIDSRYIYDPSKPLADQSPKFHLFDVPETGKYLLVDFNGDHRTYLDAKLKPFEVTSFVRSVIHMMAPNAEVTLGPVPYYCGGQGHYTAAETQWIRMANLAQLDARTVG